MKVGIMITISVQMKRHTHEDKALRIRAAEARRKDASRLASSLKQRFSSSLQSLRPKGAWQSKRSEAQRSGNASLWSESKC